MSAGEEIIISCSVEYDLSRSRHWRCKELMDDYFFICDCVTCASQIYNPDVTGENEMIGNESDDEWIKHFIFLIFMIVSTCRQNKVEGDGKSQILHYLGETIQRKVKCINSALMRKLTKVWKTRTGPLHSGYSSYWLKVSHSGVQSALIIFSCRYSNL